MLHRAKYLNTNPTTEVLDSLRLLKRKTRLVNKILNASVYTILLQQEVKGGGRHGNNEMNGGE